MNRTHLTAWQWVVLILLVCGALASGGTAVYLASKDPMIQDWLKSNQPLKAPDSTISGAPFVPPPLPSATFTLTASPTPSPSSTFTPTFTPTPTETPTPTPTATETPPPTVTVQPSPPPPPSGVENPVLVNGYIGHPQTYALSCESRSAADLAGFFGVSISETEFQNNLPVSDDPNLGFVGSPYGIAWQIPPASYGVHAAPVAALLRAYGLPAQERFGMTYEALQTEIAAGRPVMVWIIAGFLNGYAVEYTPASSGQTVKVAYGEHTVVVIGYTDRYIIADDQGWTNYVTVEQFKNTWGVLGNMAITVDR